MTTLFCALLALWLGYLWGTAAQRTAAASDFARQSERCETVMRDCAAAMHATVDELQSMRATLVVQHIAVEAVCMELQRLTVRPDADEGEEWRG